MINFYYLGTVSTLAGSGTRGSNDGKGIKASFARPSGICFDASDQSLLVCDYANNLLRRVSLVGNQIYFNLLFVTNKFFEFRIAERVEIRANSKKL
jgi:hypothetical protein